MQRLSDSCSAKEWNAVRDRPPSEWTDQEWVLYMWADWFRDWDYYEPRTNATSHLRNDDPRVEEIGIDHELEAEHEAAIDCLFEMDEETRESKALLAAARKECRRNLVKFTPADEAQRKHSQSKGGWMDFVYASEPKFRSEQEVRGYLREAIDHLAQKETTIQNPPKEPLNGTVS